MKLKIQIYVPDLGLRELLKIYLSGQGHEVVAFRDVAACPRYRNLNDEHCQCAQEQPCADALLVDSQMSHVNVVEFLKLQRLRGCKMMDANKVVLSAGLTSPLEKAVKEFGCHHIKKPFHLEDISKWLDGCKERLAARRQTLP
jgi:CheY-like chemotaxis protein